MPLQPCAPLRIRTIAASVYLLGPRLVYYTIQDSPHLRRVFLSSVSPDHVFCSGIDSLVRFAVDEAWVQCRPCWHKELFLVGSHTFDCQMIADTYSITQSSYSMRWLRQGVVSKTGGIETGALMKPMNDILSIIIFIIH